jgi:hypothetical protein
MAKGGANAIVAQSGGPTAVINSSVCGVIQEAKRSKKISRVLAANNGILGVLKEDLFDVSAEKPAVKAALSGVNWKMITLVRAKGVKYKCTTGLAELKDVANGEKKVPKEYINQRGNHITKACREYISPLIKGEAPITIGKDGLPVYVRLAKKPANYL